MNASFSKRLGAYLIDFIFISAVIILVSFFIPKNNTVDKLNDDINKLTEEVLNGDISFNKYFNEYSTYVSMIDTNNVLNNTISLIIIIIYYVIIPSIYKTTLGKNLMHLYIKRKDDKELNFTNMLVRGFIDVGILYSLVTVFLAQILSGHVYLYTLIILGIIQILLVFISAIMILYRSDKCGLQDILSKSNVVLKEVKE